MTDPTLLRRAIESVGIEKPSDYTLVLEEIERLKQEICSTTGIPKDALEEAVGVNRGKLTHAALEAAKKISGNFQYKTYRCEWLAEVYEVDQYGQRQRDAEVWYESVWPTREEAISALDRCLEPDPQNPNRRGRYPEAKHGYYNVGVRYREARTYAGIGRTGETDGPDSTVL